MFTAIYDNGITKEDITRYVKRYGTSLKSVTLDSSKYLYLGSMLKFNHAFLKFVAAAVTTNAVKVELYDGSSDWNDVAHVVDETDGLSTDGVIEFIPDLDNSWSKANTEDIAELNTVKIYGRYWLRISFDAETVAELGYVGHRFSDDVDLFEEFAQLNNAQFLSYFDATTYDKQAIKAGEIMEKDLMVMGKAAGIEQVLNRDSLTLPSVYKVAEIAYSQFGDEHRDMVAEIRKEYNARLRKAVPIIDKANTAEDSTNKQSSITFGELRR